MKKTLRKQRKFLKLVSISLSAFILCMFLLPGQFVSAYTGGLFNGKPMYTWNTGTTTTVVTDNDEATSVVLTTPGSAKHYVTTSALGGDSYTVTGYKLKGSSTTNWEMHLLNASNGVIQKFNVTADGVQRSITAVSGVKSVLIANIAPGSQTLYEFDAFGTLIDGTPPPVPTLSGTAGNGQVSLTWSAVTAPDLAGYFLWKDGVKINSTAMSQTTYNVTGLTNGVAYSFQVSSVDDKGNESSKSTALSRTPSAPILPIAPTNLVGTPGDKNAVLTWTASTSSDKAGYNVYRNGVKRNSSLVTGTTFTDTGLTNGTTYTYTVKTVDSASVESVGSNSVTVTPTAIVIPLAMTLSGNGTSIIVSVTGGKMPYEVNWGGPQTDTFSATTHYIVGLTKSTTYTVTLTDDNGAVVTKTVDTGSFSAPLVPIMPDSTSLFQSMINSFGKAGTIALIVIGGAISLGLIVILALWAWRLTKKWLASSK